MLHCGPLYFILFQSMSGNVIEKGKKVLHLQTNQLWANTFALVSYCCFEQVFVLQRVVAFLLADINE